MRLKVNEAIAQSEANGKKVLKQEIAKKLFKPEWINIICHECDCTPNFLFGFE